jgi:hypothetical protein
MTPITGKNFRRVAALCFLLACVSSCMISKKMDVYVSSQYGDQLPKQNKKLKSDIVVNSVYPEDKKISKTVKKTSHFLPLIVYWQFDYRHTCTLNPAIAVASFSNTVSASSSKIQQKLNGKQIELTVEQVPAGFALVDKGHMVLFIHWDRLYVEPDHKDMIISYKVLDNGAEVKTGKIEMRNPEKDRNIRFAQSWKSCTREYISDYTNTLNVMNKAVVAKLLEEL